jgi:LAO/AO transport system kinase
MEELSRNPKAFIRPSPSSGALGGTAPRTREAILLCEAAGFDVVLVETVGVGQSETAVADMTDVFLLLLMPGGGDELQGMKRGIMELADLVIVNKADGELEAAAKRTASDYAQALKLQHFFGHQWKVPVELCSAFTGLGLKQVWESIRKYHGQLVESGELSKRRAEQNRTWLWSETSQSLLAALKNDAETRQQLPELELAVMQGTLPPPVAARRLLNAFHQIKKVSGFE